MMSFPKRYWKACGGRTRTRTLDPLIKSQLLYQLSYAPGADEASAQAGRAVAKPKIGVQNGLCTKNTLLYGPRQFARSAIHRQKVAEELP